MGDEAEVPEWVQRTQAAIGFIKRPKLTPALLQKPPFRFLHDVVSEVTKETGFAAGLYTDEAEVNSAKIKDKDSKIAYLTKIIKCVEFALNTTINIRVGKVVAGLEAENTNILLQALGEAATSGVDSNAAVQRVLEESAGQDAPPPPPAGDDYAAAPPPPPQMPPAMPPSLAGGEAALPGAPAMPERDASLFTSQPMKRTEEDPGAAAEGTDASGKRVRPKSARRPPPRVTSNEVKVEKAAPRAGGEAAPVAGVIMEGGAGEEEDNMIEMVDTAGDAVNTSSMTTRDAHDGPQGRLGKNLMDAKNEMEAMGAERERAGTQEPEEAESQSGIIIRKKSLTGQAGGGKLPSKGEVSALRNSIQTLCQSSNPLGRCLEYVQEDLEAMGKELESWRAQRQRRAGELSDEEATTASALVALKAELEKVEEIIKEKQTQIRFAKASIIRNDTQIERLLSQVVRGAA